MKITRKLMISNTFWSAVAQFGVVFINLLVVPLFIKNMGSDLYGIWVISAAIFSYTNVFDFGFTQGLQKYVADAQEKKCTKELSEVVVSGVGLLSFIGLLLGYIFYNGAYSIVEFFNIIPANQLVAVRLLQISAIFCVILWPIKIIDVILNASMRIKELNFLNAFKIGIQSTALICMVYVSADILLIKWATMVLLVVSNVCGIFMLRKYAPEIIWSPLYFRIYHLKRMHRFSLGMFYISLLGLLTVKIDKLIIAKMLDMQAVTVYTVISKLFLLIQQVTRMLMVALIPAVYNMSASNNLIHVDRLVYKAVKYRMLVTCSTAYICILVSSVFIRLWVGDEYVEYAFWSQILCVVPLFVGLGVGNAVARGMGHIKEANAIYTVQIILNFIISIILVPYFGVGGPVLGTVISVILIGDFSMFPFFCRLIGIQWKKTFVMALLINITGLFVFFSGIIIYKIIPPTGWFSLLFYTGIMYMLFAVVFGYFFLREELKEFFEWCIFRIHRCFQ